MKIIHNPMLKVSKVKRSKYPSRTEANEGCDVCPICGESRSIFDNLKTTGEFKGVSKTMYATYIGGLFTPTTYADFYHCNTCGARWRSDRWEIDI